jgi:beta-N-acetylhexosaminidase
MWESSHLTEAERIGQLLFVGIMGQTLTPETSSFLRALRPGGIILFQRNVASRDQVQRLCRALTRLLPVPPFIAIDQEGGRVNRLQPILSRLPACLDLAELGDRRMVERYARGVGTCLRLLGLHIDFAPVLDLSGRDADNGIGDRAFGTDPERVTEFGESFLQALKRSQILGTMKHFPGLGAAALDSHLGMPEIRKGRKKLWEEDLLPFRTLARLAPIAMVGHGWYPSLSGKDPVPASLSPRIVEDLLLGEIGYRGLVVSDDLEMGSIDARGGMGRVAVQAVSAGNDMLLVCRSKRLIRAAARGLLEAARKGTLADDRVERSVKKILALKRRFLRGQRVNGSAQQFRQAAAEVSRIQERIEQAGRDAAAARRRGPLQGASRPVRRRKISR